MSICDDIIVDVKTAFEAAGRAAGQFADVSKLRLAAAELRSEIDKTYKKLGMAVYAATASETDCAEDVQNYVTAIEELKAQLASVNEAICDASSKTKCAACGAILRKGDAFCGKCGTKHNS